MYYLDIGIHIGHKIGSCDHKQKETIKQSAFSWPTPLLRTTTIPFLFFLEAECTQLHVRTTLIQQTFFCACLSSCTT